MNIESIKKWLSDAKAIKEVKGKFRDSTSNSNIDKYKLGFNADSRFKSFSATVYFGGYTGSYGDSSVYSFLSLRDNKVAEEAIIQYIKDNEDDILCYISDFYLNKAVTAKDKAKKSLIADLSIIEDLESPE